MIKDNRLCDFCEMEYPTKHRKRMKEKLAMVSRDSIGAELHHLDEDKSITTDPGENSKRRTLKLTKKDNSWGFTLQTYGIKHKKTNEVEIMTYVDYIEIHSAAWFAGLRRGDVILSVNGERVGDITHQQLVDKIRQAGNIIRLVVLFEDCCRKVDLHERYMKLKAVLKSKYQELREIEQQEMQILENYCQSKGLNRFEQIRQSILSNVSSSSESWDAYSVISSPNGVLPTGHFAHNKWSSATSLKSYSMGDNSSMFDDNYSFIDSESDSDGISVTVNVHNSDSNLVTKYAKDPRMFKVKDASNNRIARSSDSQLYSRSLRRPKQGHVLVQSKQLKSEESMVDEVFIEEEMNESATFPRNKKRLNARENKVFYAGENGNIIVPKICIDGAEMYTTFDEIVTPFSDVPNIDPENYQDNVVAIEIAKEMTRLEKQEVERKLDTNGKISDTTGKLPETNGKLSDTNGIMSDKNGKISETNGKLSDINGKLSSTNASQTNTSTNTLQQTRNTGVNAEGASSETIQVHYNGAKSKPTTFPGGSFPKTGFPKGRSNIGGSSSPGAGSPKSRKNIGGSMSYEQLKSSVPDIRVSFHTEECEVIYINENDETTRL